MHIPDCLFLCRFLICPALFSIMAHIAFPMVLILTLSWTDQTFLIKSDQICPSCFYQCLIDKIVILRIPVLDQCALHCLLMRIDRNIDFFHCARIYSGIIHAGRQRGRCRIKILHLLRHIPQIPDVFWRRYALEEPENLNLDAMREAAELLLGEHDFKAFTSAKKSKKSTIRRIDEIRIEQIEDRIEFVFTGNGFLHHMIRILMGTLLEVGKGIRTPESVTDVLKSGDRAKAGALVPAKGLVLEEVFYT